MDEDTYEGKVGCWNCDNVYHIPVTFGIVVPEYLVKEDPKCVKCGCQTLKRFNEYAAEKKVMKDIILHHNIEHLEDPDIGAGNEHSHYG